MSWFKFKTKEEKLKELQEQLKEYENTYCFDRHKFNEKKVFNDGIFIFKGVYIKDNELLYKFKTTRNIDGYITTLSTDLISVNKIKKMREDFLLLKAQLNHFGLEIKSIE